jgi:hypothetical protein
MAISLVESRLAARKRLGAEKNFVAELPFSFRHFDRPSLLALECGHREDVS